MVPPRAKLGHACTTVSKQVENVLAAAILAHTLLEDWTDLPDGVRYLIDRIIDHANDTEAAFDNLKERRPNHHRTACLAQRAGYRRGPPNIAAAGRIVRWQHVVEWGLQRTL
jgi:hypothetical protein